MAVGLGSLRLAPAAFWTMTPREFAAVLTHLFAEPGMPLERIRLSELMQRFPD